MYKHNLSLKVNSRLEYIKNQYHTDFNDSQKNIALTGFENIDTSFTLKKGLHLIGGVPSVGKTTFLVQLVDQLAMNGNHVLFMSLEQNEFDLTYKSLRRLKYLNNLSSDEEAIELYSQFADRIVTVTTETSVSIDDIEYTVNTYVNNLKTEAIQNNQEYVPPIVVIDYLQLIKADNFNQREGVNYISNVLINLKKRHNLIMLVVSSLNRANYMSQIDFESFKESGNLEYDADVLLGIQYGVMNNEKFESNTTSINTKRKLIHEAKSESIRDVEIVCLKNRGGSIPERWTFKYNTDCDLFIPQKSVNIAVDNKATKPIYRV